VHFVYDINENFSEQQKNEVIDIINMLSNGFTIDKSYVKCKENKHDDVFMNESGWNELCDLVILTKLGKKSSVAQNAILQESFCAMILCYAYMILETFGYSSDDVILELSKNGKFMLQYEIDTCEEWKSYLGKWQQWM